MKQFNKIEMNAFYLNWYLLSSTNFLSSFPWIGNKPLFLIKNNDNGDENQYILKFIDYDNPCNDLQSEMGKCIEVATYLIFLSITLAGFTMNDSCLHDFRFNLVHFSVSF